MSAASHDSVRKYICEPCAREMGAAMGMVDGEIKQLVENERDAALMRAEIAESELAAAREQTVRVVAADEVADVVAETVRAELAKKVKRAPAQAE